jgi:hypothetical protein
LIGRENLTGDQLARAEHLAPNQEHISNHMSTYVYKHTVGLTFGVPGFVIGMALCGYTFYLTSHHLIGSTAVFLVLCPPSIGAMALDNAGVIGGIVGWFSISFVNGALYLAIGALFDRARASRAG